ncbi:MAG: helix-turn-helix domain-containing protein [Christensenellales bacterium]
MPVIKYRVILPSNECGKLAGIISKGTASAKFIMHAHILLAADESKGKKRSGKEIAGLFHVNAQTVHTIRKTYAAEGLEAAVGRKKRQIPPIQPKITGDVEAKIIALSCSEPPEGRSKWAVRL